MALCAKIAYLDGPEAKPEYEALGYTGHEFFDIDGAQCHAVWNDETYVLCFRGTEPDEITDVLADLKAFPRKSMTDGWVHMGFRGELDKIWLHIKEHQRNYQGREFRICGHSLGAAMATLATSRFEDVIKAPVTSLYTFGSPRVGTRSFIKGINTPHFRFVNNNDIVTTVPLALMGYKHHGQRVYINYHGKIRKLTFWQVVKDKLRGYRSGVLDGAMDHSMDNYVKFINENLG